MLTSVNNHSISTYSQKPKDVWTSEFTQKFVNKAEPLYNAIQQLFIRNLRFTGNILEVGAGSQGGVTHYLPSRELGSLITLTEPTYTKNPRIKQIHAHELSKHFGKIFDTVFAVNVMDCILEKGFTEGENALNEMKKVLKPNGEIKFFHYFGPTAACIGNIITEKYQDYTFFPYQTSSTFPLGEESQVKIPFDNLIFIEKSRLKKPFDPSNPHSKSLQDLINSRYSSEEQALFYRDAFVSFAQIITKAPPMQALANEIGLMIDKIGIEAFKARYGAIVKTYDELFIERIYELAERCLMSCDVELQLVSAPAAKGKNIIWYDGPRTLGVDPHVQHLFCKIFTLREKEASYTD